MISNKTKYKIELTLSKKKRNEKKQNKTKQTKKKTPITPVYVLG